MGKFLLKIIIFGGCFSGYHQFKETPIFTPLEDLTAGESLQPSPMKRKENDLLTKPPGNYVQNVNFLRGAMIEFVFFQQSFPQVNFG